MKTVIAVIILLGAAAVAFAADKPAAPAPSVKAANAERTKTAANEKMVGRTIKILAKTYVRTINLARLKQTHIQRIQGLDDEEYRKTYAYTLALIAESPRLKQEFGLSEEMGRLEAIARLERIDKRTLYRMIDAVPDHVIFKRFSAYMSRSNDELKEGDITKRIEVGWKTFQERRLDK